MQKLRKELTARKLIIKKNQKMWWLCSDEIYFEGFSNWNYPFHNTVSKKWYLHQRENLNQEQIEEITRRIEDSEIKKNFGNYC